MSDERENTNGAEWNDPEGTRGQTDPHETSAEPSKIEGLEKHVISMELKIDIEIGKSKVGHDLFLTGPFAKVNWSKLDDIKVDVKSVLSIVCDVDVLAIDVIESIPDAIGIQHPRLLITLPAGVTSHRLTLCEPALENYFHFLSDPEAEVPTALVQPPAEVNEEVRNIARDCCVRRGGRSLPCQISISSEQFTHTLKADPVVAKVTSPLTTENEVLFVGKANGLHGHAQILHFIQTTVAESKKGLKERKKHRRISYETATFLDAVLAMKHVTETRYVLTVAECKEGKKKWWKLRRIRLATDCITNAA